ncbi:MAG: hypothetical protein DME19_04455 [Verrucomicrobia bacterium]|nr:MAG: hypothetical protein DME19_04455 [Verrucomicrobiota bacterium]
MLGAQRCAGGVEHEFQRDYYDLIKKFSERSGVPAVLNTSFNENEPIVETPDQAVNCFVRTDVDVLVLGPFVTVKREQGAGSKEQGEHRTLNLEPGT